jgi:hypothetical protein
MIQVALDYLLTGYADRTALLLILGREVKQEPSQLEAAREALAAVTVGNAERTVSLLVQMLQFELADERLSLPPTERSQPWFCIDSVRGAFRWSPIKERK